MFFSNLMGDIAGKYSRYDSFPLTLVDTDGASTKRVKIVEVDGNMELKLTDEDGTDIFDVDGNKDDVFVKNRNLSSKYADESSVLYVKDVADTDDNPLIVVSTKGFRCYYNIPTYIKVLFVNSSFMLAELIYGACEFQFADGSFVALQRCDDSDLNNREMTDCVTCEWLNSTVKYETAGGHDKSYCAVLPFYISAVRRKRDNYVSYGIDKDNIFVFDQDSIDSAEAKEIEIANKKAREEEIRKAERAMRAAEAEENRKKKEYDLAQRKLAEQAEKAKRNAERISQSKTSKRSSGAEAFLAMLNLNNE